MSIYLLSWTKNKYIKNKVKNEFCAKKNFFHGGGLAGSNKPKTGPFFVRPNFPTSP